ncbi:hypothetical protein L1887_10690 [Cichorium endivia]|nr:hypothetical protein L1887_10690 [Cichorium endivia]
MKTSSGHTYERAATKKWLYDDRIAKVNGVILILLLVTMSNSEYTQYMADNILHSKSNEKNRFYGSEEQAQHSPKPDEKKETLFRAYHRFEGLKKEEALVAGVGGIG